MAVELDGKLPVAGDDIKVEEKRYKLIEALGDGGYGQVFLGVDGDRRVAVKTEKCNKSMLHIEVNVLRAANVFKCKHICELLGYGAVKPDYVFIVMTLLHKDLHKLRAEMTDRKFTFSTAVRLGLQSLEAIEELHKIGFLSRDIKPGNFAPGHSLNGQGKTLFLYDFGLARRYLDKNNNIIPSRREIGWRGTTRYGSLNAHLRMDLGRRDDLESWFYMLVEMTRGVLPWRLVTDRGAVQTAKQFARGGGRSTLLTDCPKQYDTLLDMVDAMLFETDPDYHALYTILDEARTAKGIRMNSHWDWEDDTNTSTNTVSSFSDKELRAKKDSEENKKADE